MNADAQGESIARQRRQGGKALLHFACAEHCSFSRIERDLQAAGQSLFDLSKIDRRNPLHTIQASLEAVFELTGVGRDPGNAVFHQFGMDMVLNGSHVPRKHQDG